MSPCIWNLYWWETRIHLSCEGITMIVGDVTARPSPAMALTYLLFSRDIMCSETKRLMSATYMPIWSTKSCPIKHFLHITLSGMLLWDCIVTIGVRLTTRRSGPYYFIILSCHFLESKECLNSEQICIYSIFGLRQTSWELESHNTIGCFTASKFFFILWLFASAMDAWCIEIDNCLLRGSTYPVRCCFMAGYFAINWLTGHSLVIGGVDKSLLHMEIMTVDNIQACLIHTRNHN